ncbi:two-partner secretion domain-containing protein [Candidatus Nitrospira salsa]
MVRRSPLRQLTQKLGRLYSPLVSFCILGVVFFSMVLPAFVVAQVATTITLDSSLPFNTVVTQIGDVHSIEAGTVRGQNQFHSFSQFDLGTGQIASFNGPATIVNILSRVTGGVPSSIDGTLRSSIEGTNMFFLNPAGVIFGAEAKLDLTGSFHVSTADFLRFEDEPRSMPMPH